MDKDIETYRFIFSCIKNGLTDVSHRTKLISGNIDFLWSVRKELEYLNLQAMVKPLDYYLEGRFFKYTFVVLKDIVWQFIEFTPKIHDNSTLERRVINSKKVLKDSNGLVYLDISNKDRELLYTKWNNYVSTVSYYDMAKYKDDPVTLLARKLGFIKEIEVVK